MVNSSSDTHRRTHAQTALGAKVLVAAAACIVGMLVDQGSDELDFVRRAVGSFVYPIQIFVSLPSEFADWTAQSRVSRADLKRQNDSLKIERLRTLAELQKFNDLKAENERLRAMLSASDKIADNYIMAELVAADADRYRHSIVIDKGLRKGIYEGQAMVDANGVIGQVIEAGEHSSIALLISDPDHMLPVVNLRNGLRTFVVGTGDLDQLSVQQLPNSADIEVGDQLVTSGLGGAFPAGYPVAVVKKVDRQPDQPFAKISAQAIAKLDQITELVLISSNNSEPDISAGSNSDE